MHVYYKFGLLLIFLLSVSISYTAPAEKSEKDNASSDDEYDYDYEESGAQSPLNVPAEEAPSGGAAIWPLDSTTTTTTFRPIFSIPRRSSRVLEPTCPRNCLCLEDYKFVQCIHAHLTHVPLDLPKMAAIIDLSHNDIVELRAEDFANLSKVVEINLSDNLLKRLDKEAFNGLERLQRLRLANNQITKLEPDTFAGATGLLSLDLSNNSIIQRTDGSLLDQPSLNEFSCANCSWTELPEQIFVNMSGLTALRLDQNEFKRQINTQAFAPLKSIIKLKLPELDQANIEELCNFLKSIDNISFRHFNVSCFQLVLGASFNESVIQVTDPPPKSVTGLPSTTKTVGQTPPRPGNRNRTKATNETATVAKAGVMTGNGESDVNKTTDKEEPYQVAISQETINTLLICIMAIAVLGIVVGLIFRKDVGGIKTKCCRTSKPEPKDQSHPLEEIPLNKQA